jgi:hypothetical protein
VKQPGFDRAVFFAYASALKLALKFRFEPALSTRMLSRSTTGDNFAARETPKRNARIQESLAASHLI